VTLWQENISHKVIPSDDVHKENIQAISLNGNDIRIQNYIQYTHIVIQNSTEPIFL